MRKFMLLSAVAAAALGVASTAHASTISIGTSINANHDSGLRSDSRACDFFRSRRGL